MENSFAVRRVRAAAGLVIFLACALHAGLANARHIASQNRLDDSVSLLDEAYQLSRSFGKEERANTLLDLADAAVLINPERANRWSLELFESAKTMPLGQFRAAMEEERPANAGRP